MHHVEVAQAPAGHVRHHGHPRGCGHACDLRGPDEAAAVMQVGLHDVQAAVLDGPLPAAQAELLLTARDRDGERIGDFLRLPKPVERARLLVEGVAMLLHQPADADGLAHVVGTVGVGEERHAVAERLAYQWNQGLGASGKRIDVAVHASAETELEGPHSRSLDKFAQVRHFLLGFVAALAAGVVDRDVSPLRTPEEIRQGPLRRLTQQLQQRHLHRGDVRPQRQALHLVVAVVPIRFPEQLFEPACVLLEEHGHYALQEDRIQLRHARRVRHGDRLDPVTGSGANQELLAVAEQFDRCDGHRLLEEIQLQHGIVEDAIERGLGDRFWVRRAERSQSRSSSGAGSRGFQKQPARG